MCRHHRRHQLAPHNLPLQGVAPGVWGHLPCPCHKQPRARPALQTRQAEDLTRAHPGRSQAAKASGRPDLRARPGPPGQTKSSPGRSRHLASKPSPWPAGSPAVWGWPAPQPRGTEKKIPLSPVECLKGNCPPPSPVPRPPQLVAKWGSTLIWHNQDYLLLLPSLEPGRLSG